MIRPNLNLPATLTAPPPVADKLDTYRRLTAEATTARGQLARLEQQTAEMEAASRQAIAAALTAGEPEPSTKSLDAHRAEVDKQRRRVAGYDTAVNTAYNELVDGITTHRQAWLAEARADVDDATARFRRAIAELTAAYDDLEIARAAVVWVATFDAEHTMFRKRQPQSALTRAFDALTAVADEAPFAEPEPAPEPVKGMRHGTFRQGESAIDTEYYGNNWPDRAA